MNIFVTDEDPAAGAVVSSPTFTPEHQRIMDEDRARQVEALLQEGLKVRALCERVLSPDGADSVAAGDALMAGCDGAWCSCAVARRVTDALNAERREGRREGLAAAGHLCLELSRTVDPKVNLDLRKGMHDAGAIILSMKDHEACQRAQARAAEVASWAKPTEAPHV